MHYAAAYGRLPHIHPDFCDIKPLSEDDFQDYEMGGFDFADTKMKQDWALYLVHFAELISRGIFTCLLCLRPFFFFFFFFFFFKWLREGAAC